MAKIENIITLTELTTYDTQIKQTIDNKINTALETKKVVTEDDLGTQMTFNFDSSTGVLTITSKN
jgi:hypothetical protein